MLTKQVPLSGWHESLNVCSDNIFVTFHNRSAIGYSLFVVIKLFSAFFLALFLYSTTNGNKTYCVTFFMIISMFNSITSLSNFSMKLTVILFLRDIHSIVWDTCRHIIPLFHSLLNYLHIQYTWIHCRKLKLPPQ